MYQNQNQKRDVCRNFQRGSCRYGDRCRFLHTTQQQQQQLKPNPFAFNSSSSSSSSSGFGFGANQQNQNHFKNKWTRPSASNPKEQQQQQQHQHQLPSTANHICTDPEACKRQIAEDFQHERPLWNLTCYAHSKYLPCDIFGDISYEELRSLAYRDAKRGLTLPSIIERERNLLNSKVVEFDNLLLRNPYPAGPMPFPPQNNVPPSLPSFTQLANISSPVSSNSAFQKSWPQVSHPISGGFGLNGGGLASETPGLFPSQQHMQSSGGVPTSVQMSSGSVAPSLQFPSAASSQSTIFSYGNNMIEGVPSNTSIWLKETWNPGEIPEEAPPDGFV